jgi:hypothetical protein
MRKDGGPAFPMEYSTFEYTISEGNQRIYHTQHDMTLRDWFAGMALQGIMANTKFTAVWRAAEMVDYAYRAADAMLEAREVNDGK